MGNEWSHGIERARESDAHVAASLTSAPIARATHPCGTSAMHEAENAVNLYRCVLAALAADTGNQLEKSTTPTMESTAMQMLDVSIDRRPTSTTNWMTRFPMRGSIVDVRPKTREICHGLFEKATESLDCKRSCGRGAALTKRTARSARDLLP